MTQTITEQINAQVVRPTPLIEEAELALLEKSVLPADLFRLVVVYTGDPTMHGCDALAQRMIVQSCNLSLGLRQLFRMTCFAFPLAKTFGVVKERESQDVNLDGYMNMARFCWEAMDLAERNTVYQELFFYSSWRAPIHVASAFVDFSTSHWSNRGSYFTDFHATFHPISEMLRLNHGPDLSRLYAHLRAISREDGPAAIRSWLEKHNEALSEIGMLKIHDGITRFLPPEVEMLAGVQEMTVNFRPSWGKGIILADLNRCQDLRELTLYNCHLEHSAFSSLAKLRSVTLYNCGLKQVPSFIQGLNHLSFLDLSHNEIEELPAFLGSLPVLESLYLNDNHLTEVPLSLRSNPVLQTLSLWGNRLTSLHPDFRKMKNLMVEEALKSPNNGSCCTIL